MLYYEYQGHAFLFAHIESVFSTPVFIFFKFPKTYKRLPLKSFVSLTGCSRILHL